VSLAVTGRLKLYKSTAIALVDKHNTIQISICTPEKIVFFVSKYMNKTKNTN
jgi:hypothetical protein